MSMLHKFAAMNILHTFGAIKGLIFLQAPNYEEAANLDRGR